VSLKVDNVAHAARVAPLGDDGRLARLELVKVDDLPRLDVNLDRVAHLDEGVGVPDGAAVVRHNVRHLLDGELLVPDARKLELLLLVANLVQNKPALGVEDEAELVVGLGNLHHVHEASGESGVGAHLAVNLDVLLHANHLRLLASQGVLETVAQYNDDGQALAQLVGTLGWPGSPDAVHLGQHPVLGRIQALKVLLGASRHLAGSKLLKTRGCEEERGG